MDTWKQGCSIERLDRIEQQLTHIESLLTRILNVSLGDNMKLSVDEAERAGLIPVQPAESKAQKLRKR